MLHRLSEYIADYFFDRSSSSYPWYCNKIDFFQPTSSFTYGELYTHWDISHSWYKPSEFYGEWLNYMNDYGITNYQTYTYNDIINNNFTSSDIKPIRGSIIYVYQLNNNVKNYLFAGYVVQSDSIYNESIVYYHNSPSGGSGKTLTYLLSSNYSTISNTIRVTIINPF